MFWGIGIVYDFICRINLKIHKMVSSGEIPSTTVFEHSFSCSTLPDLLICNRDVRVWKYEGLIFLFLIFFFILSRSVLKYLPTARELLPAIKYMKTWECYGLFFFFFFLFREDRKVLKYKYNERSFFHINSTKKNSNLFTKHVRVLKGKSYELEVHLQRRFFISKG